MSLGEVGLKGSQRPGWLRVSCITDEDQPLLFNLLFIGDQDDTPQCATLRYSQESGFVLF